MSLLYLLAVTTLAAVTGAQQVDIDIWRTAGPFASGPGVAAKIVDSPGRDASPHVSRDGLKIVFSSTRSGAWEVWTCNSDGSNPFQVTRLGDTPVGSTRWSPDGRRIYYTSNRGGAYQVWKIAPQGGDSVQLTRHGGYTPFESPDGEFVYYAKGLKEHSLWRVPTAGGEESFVLDNVVSNRWVMLNQGICILNMDADPRPAIEFYDFAGGGRRRLDVLPKEGEVYGGGTAIAAPPDGRWLLYGQIQ